MSLMEKMMGKMMEGMEGMMSSHCQGEAAKGSHKMPSMMTEMMPHCLQTMLPGLPSEQRKEFALRMIRVLGEQAARDMTAGERREFASQLEAAAREGIQLAASAEEANS